MNFKQSITYGLLTLLSVNTLAAQATPCCCRPIRCCLPPLKSNMHRYVDIGLGQSISSRLSGSDNFVIITNFDTSKKFFLSPQKMAVENIGAIESGVVWAQPLLSNSHFLPYASLGLRYQYSNLNNDRTLLRFTNMDLGSELKSGEVLKQSFSDAYYDVSQHSLLANLKVDLYRWRHIMPYLNLGVGPTWSKVKQKTALYLESPLNVELQTDNQTNNHFTYIVGVGLDFPITERFWLSVGYQYNHLGDISLNSKFVALNKNAQDFIDNIKYNESLLPIHLKNLKTRTFQFTGRYVFG